MVVDAVNCTVECPAPPRRYPCSLACSAQALLILEEPSDDLEKRDVIKSNAQEKLTIKVLEVLQELLKSIVHQPLNQLRVRC